MDVNQPEKWDANYEQGTDGWDLGKPTAVFQRLLQSQDLLPGRIIVLGAGRGYDAREFARHSFQVQWLGSVRRRDFVTKRKRKLRL